MEYKFRPISINVENVEDIKMPAFEERIIEKHGGVTTFTFAELKANIEKMTKLKEEVESKIKHEEAVIENIKHFHPHIAEMSEQDLLTAWMYKESTGEHGMYTKKMAEIDYALNEDIKQMAEIQSQIPELNPAE